MREPNLGITKSCEICGKSYWCDDGGYTCGSRECSEKEEELSMIQDLEPHYGELRDIYHTYAPDDEDFLEDNPDVQVRMDALDNFTPETSEEYSKGIQAHIYFINEWFPDGVEQEEQDRINKVLEEAEAAIQ